MDNSKKDGSDNLVKYKLNEMSRDDAVLALIKVTPKEIKEAMGSFRGDHLWNFNDDAESEYMTLCTVRVAMKYKDEDGHGISWRAPSVFSIGGCVNNNRGYNKLLCQGYIFEALDPDWNKKGQPEDRIVRIYPTKLLLKKLQEYFERKSKE